MTVNDGTGGWKSWGSGRLFGSVTSTHLLVDRKALPPEPTTYTPSHNVARCRISDHSPAAGAAEEPWPSPCCPCGSSAPSRPSSAPAPAATAASASPPSYAPRQAASSPSPKAATSRPAPTVAPSTSSPEAPPTTAAPGATIRTALSGSDTGPEAPYTRDNATPVADDTTGDVFLVSTGEPVTRGTRLPYVQKSTGDGLTFGAPRALTRLSGKTSGWFATGPARIHLAVRNELDDTKPHRTHAISTDGGATVGRHTVANLTTPQIQASVLALRHTYQDRPGDTLVLAAPSGSTGGEKLRIRYSTDRGTTWTDAPDGQLNADRAGYSDLAELTGGEPGLVYEGGTDPSTANICFSRFTPTAIGLPGTFDGTILPQPTPDAG
ncbi:hypothetical protein PV408_44625, partial [Streptomyces sp. ME18-1-4]|nr:hypothetical protein [Streptomyces sp. ME18-1-4]